MNEEGEFKIRVTMDGGYPKYDLIRGQIKIGDMSYLDVLNLGLNCTSALRWMPRPPGK